MSSTTKSTVISQPKPVNVFYVWYSELCRRLNSSPAPVVKPAKTKCQTVLDFVGDRLKLEEWHPVIKALRQDTSLHVITIRSKLGNCQFLHEIDTEDKARRMKRRYGTLWTAYILKSLLKSLSYSIRNNQVLTCLELDGLPMFTQYLEPLLQALKKNRTIKSLSLTHCPIKDIGCQMVCAYLRFTPNVEVVNLSSCLLTAESGQHLAQLIKYQQINRYCESWHHSLRYEDPHVEHMRGIKRLTLNGNYHFGDEGLNYILNELDDDLWIKALDCQKCGITEDIAEKLLDVVEYNRSLEIADFRHNDQLSLDTIDKIFTVLKQRQEFGHQGEFKWCSTMVTLPCASVQETYSSYSVATNKIQKSKSAPMKETMSTKLSSMFSKKIRRTKTETSTKLKPSNMDLEEEKKRIIQLSSQLNEEIAKRKETEKLNLELKRKLEEIQSVTSIENHLKSKENVNKIISALENLKPIKCNGITVPRVTIEADGESSSSQVTTVDATFTNHVAKSVPNGMKSQKEIKEVLKYTGMKNGIKNGLKNGVKIGVKNGLKNGYKNPVKNGYKHDEKNGIVKKNGYINDVKEQASQIFENILTRNKGKETPTTDDEEEDLIHYYLESQNLNDIRKNGDQQYKEPGASADLSESQVSLMKFIEELRSNNTNFSINFKHPLCPSDQVLTEADGGT